MSKLLTSEQIADIEAYWTLPAKERDQRFGIWPIRNMRDDIRALCDHLAERDRRVDELEDALAEARGG